MRPSEAIKIIKELIRSVEIVYKTNPLTDKEPHSATDALTLAISALKKQEQTNAQSVNSMRTSRPNALESLNILEQAKDDKGCVPMSLARQALRNVIEQYRWIPISEALPEEEGLYLVSVKNDHDRRYSKTAWFYRGTWSLARQNVLAWRHLPEPYTEEES